MKKHQRRLCGVLLCGAMAMQGCASAPPPPPSAAPESMPATEEAASTPSITAETITLSREQFNHMAATIIEHNRQKNLEIAELNRRLSLETAQDDAAQAMVSKQNSELTMWKIFGPTGAALLGVAVGLFTHYVLH